MLSNVTLKSSLSTALLLLCLIGITLYMYKINKRLNIIASSCSKVEVSPVYSNNFQCDLAICSATIGGRSEFFKMLPDVNKVKALEIAPWFAPVLVGDGVKYFDVFDQKTLIEKAKADGQSIEKIPHMDYTDPTGDMSGIKEKFALVFSSHNIEHQIDLVRHLNQVAALLEDNGKFFLAAPDKRFCFDHYIAITPLSEVLAVYWQNPKAHSLQTTLSMRCETTHNDSAKHWVGDSGDIIYKGDQDCYFNALKEYNDANGSYIDAHKWRFTPESFYTIVEELYKMKLQPLRVEKVFCTAPNSHEFYAILYKPSAEAQAK